MYIRRLKTMNVPFDFCTIHKTTEERALLDSGATENFLNEEVWKELGIGRFKLAKSLAVHNVDGTENRLGRIEYFCWFKIRYQGRFARMKFYLTDLGEDRFILGYPFLYAFNPNVDWRGARLRGGPVRLETAGFKKADRRVEEYQQRAREKAGKITESDEIWVRRSTVAQEWSRDAHKSEGERELPIEYQRHKQIFDEDESKRFPPERDGELEIPLLPDAPKTLDCKVYPLTREERDLLRTFLAEEQEKGYIYPGGSPYTAPVFFIGKKDSDEKRIIMDYRKLNDWTIRDNGPLPNIRTQLEKLQGKELFSKMDIRWGYKNHRIKKEDQYKAAFKTIYGTYVPRVVYFGLKNAPPFFQRMMAREFSPIMQKYESYLSNYLDDWIVATPGGQEGLRLHRQIMHEFLDLMEKLSYFLKLKKCEFERPKVEFLGWSITKDGITVDPSKAKGLAEWPRQLRNLKELRRTLGILGYQRPFIRGYAALAKPLTELTKKNVPFVWKEEHTKALDQLIQRVTTAPVLACPDPDRQFFLEVDASSFALGAVLFQKESSGKRRDVAYFSKALTATERNYDIWDREFLAIVVAFRTWRHLLAGTQEPVQVLTDHANLQYYRHPQKINRRVARYINFLEDFNYQLKHIPGVNNRADALSRRPDYDDGTGDNDQIIALPNELFAKAIAAITLDETIKRKQRSNQSQLKEWANKYYLTKKKDGVWYKETALVVPEEERDRRTILETYHDALTSGHPGAAKTLRAVNRDYWWPEIRRYVQEYIRGCAKCQENKTNTHPNKPPLQPITPDSQAQPFSTISVDFIVKLPESNGYNTILTITDHDCTKSVILLPCREEMGSLEVAKLYLERVFPFTGLPTKVISDRDPKFTSKVFKEVCDLLQIKQNMSSAYHPQTDGQSEKTNQHVETALRIFGNFRQDDWSELLPIIQYQINARVSDATKQVPYETWMGFIPRTYQPTRDSFLPSIEERKLRLRETWKMAKESMARAQSFWKRSINFQPYEKGDKVWLEGTNLKTSHPTTKLRPKRFGPFEITEKLGAVTYRLALPGTWKLHNAFHAAVLSPYKETAVHGVNYPSPTPELIDGEPEWEIEEILGSRHHGRKRGLQYLVKWVGYPSSDNSWEPAENVHAPELVDDFHKRSPEAIRGIKLTESMKKRKTPPELKSRILYPEPSSSCRNYRTLPPSMTCCVLKREIRQTSLNNRQCHLSNMDKKSKLRTNLTPGDKAQLSNRKRAPVCIQMKERCSTQVRPGLDGLLKADDHRFASGIKTKSSTAHIFDTKWKEASHTRWEPKEKDNKSSSGRYVPVHKPDRKTPLSMKATSSSSPEIYPSTSLLNKPWNDLETRACWPMWDDCEPSAQASQCLQKWSKLYKNSPSRCTSSTRPLTVRSPDWLMESPRQREGWKRRMCAHECKKLSNPSSKAESYAVGCIGPTCQKFQKAPTKFSYPWNLKSTYDRKMKRNSVAKDARLQNIVPPNASTISVAYAKREATGCESAKNLIQAVEDPIVS